MYEIGEWPDDFNKSIVVLTEKKANATECGDFRTISLIPGLHTYIHTYVRTYIRTYMHTYIHTQKYLCTIIIFWYQDLITKFLVLVSRPDDQGLGLGLETW